MQLILVGCGSSQAAKQKSEVGESEPREEPPEKTEPVVETPKFDLDAQLAREFEPLGAVEVKDPSGGWSSVVESSGTPRVSVNDSGTGEVIIPLGTQFPMNCFVYSKAVDTGNTIGGVLASMKEAVTFHKILPAKVASVGRWVAIAVNGLYTVEKNEQKAAGMAKLAMFAHPTNPVLCVHDELGYRESFFRAASGLFDKLRVKAALPEPKHAEVWASYLGELPIGFTLSASDQKSDGSTRLATTSTMMIPRSMVDLYITEQRTMTTADSKGRIKSKKSIEIHGSEVVAEIDLNHVKKKRYAYSGVLQGKPIEGTFRTKSKAGLISEIQIMRRIEKLLAAKEDEKFEVETYAPNVDPTEPIDASYSVQSTQQPAGVEIQTGQMKIVIQADQAGNLKTMKIPLGNAEVRMELIFEDGEL